MLVLLETVGLKGLLGFLRQSGTIGIMGVQKNEDARITGDCGNTGNTEKNWVSENAGIDRYCGKTGTAKHSGSSRNAGIAMRLCESWKGWKQCVQKDCVKFGKQSCVIILKFTYTFT